MKVLPYYRMRGSIVCSATAQTSTQRINIKGCSNARDNFMKEVFKYQSFEQGIAEWTALKSIINYNKVVGTDSFTNEKGDTFLWQMKKLSKPYPLAMMFHIGLKFNKIEINENSGQHGGYILS